MVCCHEAHDPGARKRHEIMTWTPHMPDVHVAPDALLGEGVPLDGHVAGFGQGQLQHQAAAVICDAAHHVQPPRSPRHIDRVLHQE